MALFSILFWEEGTIVNNGRLEKSEGFAEISRLFISAVKYFISVRCYKTTMLSMTTLAMLVRRRAQLV